MAKIDKKSDIYLFWKKKISSNAPLTIDDQIKFEICKDYKIEPYKFSLKYPYKPFLVLAILEEFGIDSFKKTIFVESSNIIKRFYDFCSFDEYLFKILLSQKAKNKWGLGFNKILKESVFAIMKEGPLNHLQTKNKDDKNWFIYNNTTRTIFLDIDYDNIENDVENLKELCHLTVLKCLPWFEYEGGNEYLTTTGEILKNIGLTIGDTKFSSVQKRERQHLFRKDVLDRDQKCLICCIENYNILQACHIKPYANCDENEKYDDDNGITLCLNHHKLFDRGLFTLNKEAKVQISNNLLEEDIHLFFKQYEPCQSITINKFDSSTFQNKFWDYHNKNIFSK